jgi:hypothetical protein
MAVNSIASPVLQRQATEELRLPWKWLGIFIIIAVGLGWGYSSISEKVSSASNRVLRLEANLRAEQTSGDALRSEVAQLRALERIVPMASGQLQMSPAAARNTVYLSTPEYSAIRNASGRGSGSLGREPGTIALLDGPNPGQSSGASSVRVRQAGATGSSQGWAERLLAAFTPASVAASEREIGR